MSSRRRAAPPPRSGLLACALCGLLAAAAGCAGGKELTHSPASYGAPTPQQAVRTFLEAASREEYPRMGRFFGTQQGPAEKRLGLTEVERRMVVLAGLLQHESYSIEPSPLSEPDPRRSRFMVTLRGTRNGAVTVPVFAVRSASGRWFVERIVTDAVTEGT